MTDLSSQRDSVLLLGLKGWGFHGVLESERINGQEFIVDVELFFDLSHAGTSDDLSQTIDYSVVATQVVAIIEGEPFQLIEKLAQQIASRCLDHKLLDSIKVSVHKPSAPITVPFSDVVVSIVRSRSS